MSVESCASRQLCCPATAWHLSLSFMSLMTDKPFVQSVIIHCNPWNNCIFRWCSQTVPMLKRTPKRSRGTRLWGSASSRQSTDKTGVAAPDCLD